MLTRILALVVLLFVASGGAYYLLRDSPLRNVPNWRERAREFLERTPDLDKAEEFTRKVLGVLPTSAFDLATLGTIMERRGTTESLRNALQVYDEAIQKGGPGAMGIAFLKARAFRSLGLYPQAQATLLSIIDLYPFDSLMELGASALVAMSPGDAYQHFTKAREVAPSKLEEARANEGIANALLLVLALQATRNLDEGGVKITAPEGQEKMRETITASARSALEETVKYLKSDDLPANVSDANQRLIWATTIFEKLAQVKKPGTRPFSEGAILVDERRKQYAIPATKQDPALRIRLAALRLYEARDEAPPNLKVLWNDSVNDLLLSFGEGFKTAEEAKTKIAENAEKLASRAQEKDATVVPSSAGEGEAAPADPIENYIQSVLLTTRVFLNTSEFQRILQDDSRLELSQRVLDIVDAAHPVASPVLTLLRGFARLKGGNAAECERAISAYLKLVPETTRPRAVVEAAQQALVLFPTNSLCLDIFDTFPAWGGKVLDYVGRRVNFLVNARAKPELAAAAQTRLDALLKDLSVAAQDNMGDLLGVSKILYGVKGREACLELLARGVSRFPGDLTLQRLHADILFEKGVDSTVEGAARDVALKGALSAYLYLFIKAPGDSQEIVRRSVEILRKIEADRGDAGLEVSLRQYFPSASDRNFETFTAATRLFLLGQFGQAFDRVSTLTGAEAEQFRPFINYLRGNCHVGLAALLQRDAVRATSDTARAGLDTQRKSHLESAAEDFRKEPDSVACRFELANLELQDLGPKEDVPDDLFSRIKALSEQEGHEHSGHFLFARAIHHRFRVRYDDPGVKNSEIGRLLTLEQRVLRQAIRKTPTFNPAYLALAETLIIADQPEKIKGDTVNRQLLTPNYEKAISVLKAPPLPDEQVLARLVQCYELTGKYDLAAAHLEQLANVRPGPEVFGRLFTSYLRLSDPAARKERPELGFFLESGGADATAALPEPLKNKLPLLLALKKGFEALPEAPGMKKLYEALKVEHLGSSLTSPVLRKRTREAAIAAYRASLSAYEAKGVKVPVVLLNNLAWHLSEEESEASREEALRYAERLRALEPEYRRAPDAYDTYAWVLHRLGRSDEALEILNKLVSDRQTDQPTYRFRLAKVYFALRKFEEAASLIRQAIESAKPYPEQNEARDLEVQILEARRNFVGK